MTTDTDTAALVERLRKRNRYGYDPLSMQAADTIESLAAENEVLSELYKTVERQAARIKELEAFAKAAERACVDYMERTDAQAARGGCAAIDTLNAHLTAPPMPKKVEAWHVTYTDGTSEISEDREFIDALRCDLSVSRIVKLVEAADANA